MENAIRTSLGISLGAVAGALCRYGLNLWVGQQLGGEFPYATLLINVTGCFLMGGFTTYAQLRAVPLDSQLRLMVTTGFLGSYTTFSSYELDTDKLLDRNLAAALFYWTGTVLLGLIGLRAGNALVVALQKKINPTDR